MAATFLAGAYVYRERDVIRAWLENKRVGSTIITTSLYSLAIEKIDVPVLGRDGGIDAIASGVLFINRLGDAWYVNESKKIQKLGLHVPINVAEFEGDPYNSATLKRERFAVKDIFVQRRPTGIRILASFNFWNSKDDCYQLRVASLETTEDEVRNSGDEINAHWKTAFDTVPCRVLTPTQNPNQRMPTLGAGGRIVAVSDSEILLSVGGFGAETLTEESVAPPTGPRSYGSTVLINLATGEARNFTKGHRNPQGLAAARDGSIWMTDHGARGGDELNRIVEGSDYGHPTVSYGTEYESMVWRRNPRQGHHEGFEKPIYVWIPSIATSQVEIVEKNMFAGWQGDLLVSSLRAKTLFRVRVEDGRAIFAEPIEIGHRIRDITEIADGKIVLLTDEGQLVFIQPVDSSTMYRMNLAPEARGEVLASACASCHAMSPDAPDGIGPNLWRVVDRPVASREGYDYSPALRSMSGNWSRERLMQFIGDPQSVVPGTTMAMTSKLRKKEIEDVVAYLSRLQ
jgi:cytochrome c2